jgi:hypothetical protein
MSQSLLDPAKVILKQILSSVNVYTCISERKKKLLENKHHDSIPFHHDTYKIEQFLNATK